MHSTQIFTLGLGLEAPWHVVDQHLDTSVSPHRLDLYVAAERGSLFPCPECGKACPAHDFTDKTWPLCVCLLDPTKNQVSMAFSTA